MSKLLKSKCLAMSNRALNRRTAINIGLAEAFCVEKAVEVAPKRHKKIAVRMIADWAESVKLVHPMPSFMALTIADGDHVLAQKYVANIVRGMRPSKAANKAGLDEIAIKMAASPYMDVNFAQTPEEISAVYANTNMGQSCMTATPKLPGWLYGNYYGAGIAHIDNARCVVNMLDKLYGRAYGCGAEELVMALQVLGFKHSNQPLLSLPPMAQRHHLFDVKSATGAQIQYDEQKDEYFYIHYGLQPVREPKYVVMKDGSSFTQHDFRWSNVVIIGRGAHTAVRIAAECQDVLRKHDMSESFEYVVISDRYGYGNKPDIANGMACVSEFKVFEKRIPWTPVVDTNVGLVAVCQPGPQPFGRIYIDGGYNFVNDGNVWKFA